MITVKTSCNVAEIEIFICDHIELVGTFRKNKTKKSLAVNQPVSVNMREKKAPFRCDDST